MGGGLHGCDLQAFSFSFTETYFTHSSVQSSSFQREDSP